MQFFYTTNSWDYSAKRGDLMCVRALKNLGRFLLMMEQN